MRINCDIKCESNIGVKEEQGCKSSNETAEMVFKVSRQNRPQVASDDTHSLVHITVLYIPSKCETDPSGKFDTNGKVNKLLASTQHLLYFIVVVCVFCSPIIIVLFSFSNCFYHNFRLQIILL